MLGWSVKERVYILILFTKKLLITGIRHYGLLVDNTIQTINGITTGCAFKEQMQRFITKSAHERAFKTQGYDVFLAVKVAKRFVAIQSSLEATSNGAKP